ncbi:hypothetical protein PGT21_009577 [Puccinia graminis f. sp. tritici]|uniref:Uncharacterized protein n=1 Tax=Puccinia graminis f. sp. tritici TaxID=56615 RepID=A0A5B0PS31_PUCGR|nr:hypothetical protein PGT21_009577 [Puccinia graminis f. sp. tritici]
MPINPLRQVTNRPPPTPRDNDLSIRHRQASRLTVKVPSDPIETMLGWFYTNRMKLVVARNHFRGRVIQHDSLLKHECVTAEHLRRV